jgi:hypothetical protein
MQQQLLHVAQGTVILTGINIVYFNVRLILRGKINLLYQGPIFDVGTINSIGTVLYNSCLFLYIFLIFLVFFWAFVGAGGAGEDGLTIHDFLRPNARLYMLSTTGLQKSLKE